MTDKAYYAKNREAILARQRERWANDLEYREKFKARATNFRAKRKAFIAFQKAKPCMDCGNSYPTECMDFDHRDGNNKSFNVSNSTHLSEEVLLEEIAKCDLVCANCHRIRTRKRINGVQI